MNLKDKLARLEGTSTRVEPTGDGLLTPASEEWVDDFQTEFDAKIIREANSFMILKENTYPIFQNDTFQLFRDKGFISENLDLITGDASAGNINFKKTLFIDLETTGLSGGTGTYAFLIGIGHIELDHIVVRQYLLPDFQHEWLQLKQVENALLHYENIVTFNGKTFDIPLLRNRFVLNRMETTLDELYHLDVLHVSRRIWKKRLPSCDLQTLEKHILGISRVQDIPGHLIPQIYFEYLRKRKAFMLRDVLEHNYHDIVYMTLLTLVIAELVENPMKNPVHPSDLFSIARYYYRTHRYDRALPVLEHLYQHQKTNFLGKEIMYLMAQVLKKSGQPAEASRFMHLLLEKQRDHPDAIEELAKYYEHTERDFDAALEVVQQGLEHIELLEGLEHESPLLKLKKSLRHRQKRLQTKLQRQNEKASEK